MSNEKLADIAERLRKISEEIAQLAVRKPTSAPKKRHVIGNFIAKTSSLPVIPVKINLSDVPQAVDPNLIVTRDSSENIKRLRAFQIAKKIIRNRFIHDLIVSKSEIGIDSLNILCVGYKSRGDAFISTALESEIRSKYEGVKHLNVHTLELNDDNVSLGSSSNEIEFAPRRWDHLGESTTWAHPHLGNYNIIVIWDIIDHFDSSSIDTMISIVQSNLLHDGLVFMACHPWTSRHGSHAYELDASLNKAYIHLMYDDAEFRRIFEKYGVIQNNFKIVRPALAYNTIALMLGLTIVDKKTYSSEVEQFFDGDVLDKIIHLNWGSNMSRNDARKIMSITWIDYICRPLSAAGL